MVPPSLPVEALTTAGREAYRSDVMFVVGTSAVVYPAAALPERAAAGGAFVVEVNVTRTPISSMVDVTIPGSAADVLPAVLDAL